MIPIETRKAQFWESVDKTHHCWNWTGFVDALGYGRTSLAQKHWKVHRLSWFFEHGRLARAIKVLHHCDNRKCVNPSHLFLGTQQDNIRDMVEKRRHRNVPQPGEANPMAKLTRPQVHEIRRRYRYGNGYQLAREFGVSRMTITRAVQHQCWKEEKNDSN